MRLVVITARNRSSRPIYILLLPDRLNHPLKRAEARKQLRRQPYAPIELAKQMFMADSYRFREAADPHRVQSIMDHLERMADRACRLRSRPRSLNKP